MNTSTQTVSEAAIVVRLTCGVDVLVGTLTPLACQHIVLQSEKAHPLPDKTEYEKPLPNALPGTDAKIPAEKNPDYVAALGEVMIARSRFIMDSIFDLVIIGGADEAETVKRYADRLRKGRRSGTLVMFEGDTDFEIILRNFILHDTRDVNIILKAAQLHAPLSAPEVADGRALFRVDAERETRRASPLRTIAPRLERVAQGQPEPTRDGDANSA